MFTNPNICAIIHLDNSDFLKGAFVFYGKQGRFDSELYDGFY